LLSFGREKLEWLRLWCPTFFCQDVVSALLDTGIPVEPYRDDPTRREPDLDAIDVRPGDALLLVNYFGLRDRSSAKRVPDGVTLIEDHTHDPVSAWAWNSQADFCVASLRKTLPIPDGGALWSPKEHPLPAAIPTTAVRNDASSRKLAAMLMKALYLAGAAVDKPSFRAEAVGGERVIASGDISGITSWSEQLLASFPVTDWWSQRKRNHACLAQIVEGLPGVELLFPTLEESCPFSAYLVFDSPARRGRARSALCEQSVYPAVLWTLEEPVVAGISADEAELSRRMLSLHCDFRYGQQDITRMGQILAAAVESDR
ncbi:MAG: hypothetical protein RIF41_36300, partial [Polyangiaceae bacterium]